MGYFRFGFDVSKLISRAREFPALHRHLCSEAQALCCYPKTTAQVHACRFWEALDRCWWQIPSKLDSCGFRQRSCRMLQHSSPSWRLLSDMSRIHRNSWLWCRQWWDVPDMETRIISWPFDKGLQVSDSHQGYQLESGWGPQLRHVKAGCGTGISDSGVGVEASCATPERRDKGKGRVPSYE